MAKRREDVRGRRTPEGITGNKQVDARIAQGYETVGGGVIEGWEDGKIVEGTFLGLREIKGKFGPSTLAKIETTRGLLLVGCPAILANRLDTVRVGDILFIECLGRTIRTQSGNDAYDFNVMRKRLTQEEIPF